MPQVSAIAVDGGLYKPLLASRKYWATLLQVWQGCQNVQRVPFQPEPLLKAAKEQPLPAADAVPPLQLRPPEAAVRPDPCGSCSVCRPRRPRGKQKRQQQQQHEQECPLLQMWGALGSEAAFAVVAAAAEQAGVPEDVVATCQQWFGSTQAGPTAEQVRLLSCAAE